MLAKSGQRQDPKRVASDMRKAKDREGRNMFTRDECLRWQQVASYCSRNLGKERGIPIDRDISEIRNRAYEDDENILGPDDEIANNYAECARDWLFKCSQHVQRNVALCYFSIIIHKSRADRSTKAILYPYQRDLSKK